MLKRNTDSIVDQVSLNLSSIHETGTHPSEEVLKDLKKRKLIEKQKIFDFAFRKGPRFALVVEKQATELTSEMMLSGAWKTLSFKRYNFDAMGAPPSCGHLHPLLKVREEFRKIFLEMGFSEMPTNNFVESSFWNFDALFQPQQHPSRDAHDTFFLKSII